MRVEHDTIGGERERCATDRGGYRCSSRVGFDEVIFTFEDREVRRPNACVWLEDPHDLHVELGECVADGTIVVEGRLLNYDPARALPALTLEGPEQHRAGTTGADPFDDIYVVGTRCLVDDGHYACPSVGFRSTETHTLVAGGVGTKLKLSVTNCSTEPRQHDLRCPEQPDGFYVTAPRATVMTLTASYEGGEPYDCIDLRFHPFSPEARPTALRHDFHCPPAPDDPWGRGTYHVVAQAPVSLRDPQGVLYETDATDVLDGCGGGRETVVFGL